MAQSKETSIGRAGEYFASHVFENHGVEVYRVDGDFDCILNLNKTLLRMEVKTATAMRRDRRTYQFKVRTRDADVYCFVAMNLGMMRLMLAKNIGSRTTISFRPDQFTYEHQTSDLQQLFDLYNYDRTAQPW